MMAVRWRCDGGAMVVQLWCRAKFCFLIGASSNDLLSSSAANASRS